MLPSLIKGENSLACLNTLQRLVVARWWVLGALTALALGAPRLLDIPLPLPPLLAILGVTALLNGIAHVRYRHAMTAEDVELFWHLLTDISCLSALVFFSGGITNPLVSLLLPTVAIAGLTLPVRYVTLIVSTAVLAYSALLVFYLPLPLNDAARATRLHLTGMWLTFAVSAVMIAWFILRMSRLIRQRDAELSAAREQGLRDERVLAIGTLAAGAAHELGTPLGTMLLITGELADDPQMPAHAREDIQLLGQQIKACKEIITRLSQRAGAERLENSPLQAVDRWIRDIGHHWQALRPHSRIEFQFESGEMPQILADPRLEQSLLNLLNNAANAREGTPITLRLATTATQLQIDIADRGPGFPPAVLEYGGSVRFPPHAQGQGIGLMLTHSSIEQLGGELRLFNPEGGGACARILLPRNTP